MYVEVKDIKEMKENNLFFAALKKIKEINKKAKIWEVYFNLTSYKSQITKMKLLGVAVCYQSIYGKKTFPFILRK